MNLPNSIWSIFIPVLLLGCTVTGPADDGYERDNEWVNNGRLLSEEARTIFSPNNDQGSNALPQKAGGELVDGNRITRISPVTTVETDFVLYKRWVKARQENSLDYRKFKKWMEFEQFQQWKEKRQISD